MNNGDALYRVHDEQRTRRRKRRRRCKATTPKRPFLRVVSEQGASLWQRIAYVVRVWRWHRREQAWARECEALRSKPRAEIPGPMSAEVEAKLRLAERIIARTEPPFVRIPVDGRRRD